MANTITADDIREHFSQGYVGDVTSRKFRSTAPLLELVCGRKPGGSGK